MELQIFTLSHELPCAEFLEKGYVDVKRFGECCAACRGFGRTWACPPYEFDPMDIWQSFGSILLYAKKVIVPAELAEKEFAPEELFPAYEELLRPVKHQLLEELFQMEQELPGSMLLSAGGCDNCISCTRPAGEPCRMPEMLRYSVESIGGDVLRSINDFFGERILWAENGHLPEHYIILGGLLKK